MNQRTFDQLDKLERGAREETRPSRYAYEDSSAEYSAYEGPEGGYVQGDGYLYDSQYEHDEFVDQRAFQLTQPSFDGQLILQRTHSYLNGHGDRGQIRQQLLSTVHPPSHGPRSGYAEDFAFPANPPSFAAQGLDLSPFVLEHDQAGEPSSSPFHQPLQSSPAFNASQRRPGPYDYPRSNRPSLQRPLVPDHFPEHEQSMRYEPLGVEELQAEERDFQAQQLDPAHHFQTTYHAQTQVPKPKPNASATPVVQGISLVSTHALPDRFRAVFPYPLFNAIQSKSFDTIYNSNDNFILSAPTGSGKTGVLELAICRLVSGFAADSYKIVYQAPTKSLCSERQRDWEAKFGSLDLKCAELTGDTDAAQLRNVQHASIIVTTPEKWDSVTRKWKDHQKLMQMVKLFLIDEVHILKEDRGATLEAVVSRMKSVGSNVRFVALSATVPNSDDIATWLGKDPMSPHIPASRERFGEEFRPVRLQRHVRGFQGNANDFAFERTLDAKLPEVIAKWSQRKPIMVFCFTRKSCVETAKLLTNWWATKEPRERYWSAPRKRIVVAEKDLRDTVSSGVAFHHAGLTTQDRTAVEKGYLESDINVICCTSTLAVGVNLPCHMVIIKNTVTYQSNAVGCKEYSDLEIMQMLGRAGRPQFDDSAVAVILTRTHLVSHYEKMITGQEILESCLHNNLIEHFNAEIGLGTVTGASSAKKWLSGTFLYVRLKENPDHYKIDGDAPGRNLDVRLENICRKEIASLEENDLVVSCPKLRCTEFGDAMARYYLRFETMKEILSLPPKAKISEILSHISRAAEFKDVRFRVGEKTMYKNLNKSGSIKFPITEDLSTSAHKVSLIIQSVLGAVDLPTEDQKQQWEYQSAKGAIFQHVHRLVRCIIDCQLYLEDSVATRNALMLARSLGAQVWDDSPLHMKQLEGVGIVSIRKLVAAGISSIEELETTESHRIEQALSRNPPYGLQVQDKAKAFPKLRVSLTMIGEAVIKKGEHAIVKVKADIGFLNEKIPETFQKRAVYVCLLAETSDGHKIHFVRISAKKLNKGQDVLFSANLTSASQSIRAYVMCDEVAGTMRHVVLRSNIPAHAFPLPKSAEEANTAIAPPSTAKTSSTKRRASQTTTRQASIDSNEFDDDALDDADLARAATDGFVDIDDFEDDGELRGQPQKKKQKTNAAPADSAGWEPKKLSNGKWACKHTCGDKTICKHLCCREGVDKKPKPPKQKERNKNADPSSDPKQTQLSMTTTKKSNSTAAKKTASETLPPNTKGKPADPKETQRLNRLHDSVVAKKSAVPTLGRERMDATAGQPKSKAGQAELSFLAKTGDTGATMTSDYGMENLDSNDLPEIEEIRGTQSASRMSSRRNEDDSNFDFSIFDKPDADIEFGDGPNGFIGQAKMDLPAYAGENAFNQDNSNANMIVDDDLAVDQYQNSQNMQSNRIQPTKEQNLFIGHTSDAIPSESYTKSHLVDRKTHGTTTNEIDSGSRYGQTQMRHRAEQRALAQLAETTSKDAIQDNSVPNLPKRRSVANVEQGDDNVGSDDSVEKLVKGLLGTKHFNYIR